MSVAFADTAKLVTNPGYAYIITRNNIITCKINAKTGNLDKCNNKNGNYTDIENVSISQVAENGFEHKINNYFAHITTKDKLLHCIINPYTGMISYLNCQPINQDNSINLSNNTFNKYNYQIESQNSIAICTNNSQKCHFDHHFKGIQNILTVTIPKPIDE